MENLAVVDEFHQAMRALAATALLAPTLNHSSD